MTVRLTLGPIQQFLLHYAFDSTLETPDALFFQDFLSCFLDQPCAAMREIHFGGIGDKPLGKGCIDVLAGSLSNGNKPVVEIKGNDQRLRNIFLWVMAYPEIYLIPEFQKQRT